MAALELSRRRRVIKPRPIRIVGDIAFVPLTKGLSATIDVADVPLVAAWNWHASVYRTGHAYAVRCTSLNGKGRTILMHRHLMAAEALDEVDHIDGDGLNNRRGNLRACSHKQNMENRVISRRNQLNAKGVWTAGGKYRACIQHNNRTIHLGTFVTKAEASAAYAGAAKALFGQFARLA